MFVVCLVVDCVAFCVKINSNFGDIQYFYIDLIIVLVLAFAGMFL